VTDANHTAAPLLADLADAIESTPGRELGSGYQASVYLYTTANGDVVVKKPHRGPLGRLWRHLLRREHAVYTRLGNVVGIPRSLGLVRDEYLALEYIAGPSLRAFEAHLNDRDDFFGKLLTTLQSMHAAGVAHGDLKRKDNIIVGPNEQPYLIDFGIACRRSDTSGLWNRWVFARFRQMDYNAWVKLKYGRRIDAQTARELLSAADAALYRPLLIERLARPLRIAWQKITLRRPRQRWRTRRKQN